jgi:hypothetical protein
MAGRPGFRLLAWTRDFSLPHNVQTGSGAHPAFYPMVTGAYFLWTKAAEAGS